jgi:translation initiation factor IF-3
VIGASGDQLGVLPLRRALQEAKEAGLDLVEVSPQASPPVCKILDYGKFKFQEQKRAAEAKKKQQIVTVKEIPIRPRTDEHDYQIKLRKAREFLQVGHKVKFNLRFRGREVTHQELGAAMLDRIKEDLEPLTRVEFQSGLEGRFMSLIVAPEKKKIDAWNAQQAAAEKEASAS